MRRRKSPLPRHNAAKTRRSYGQSTSMNSYVLALDLEGTLISNAMSQIPRPGLAEFLTRCAELFPRIVMFTTVKEDRFRKIARLLVDERVAPSWFAEMEYITWHGETKDLKFVPGVHPSTYRWSTTLRSTFIPARKHSGCKLNTSTTPMAQRIVVLPRCSRYWLSVSFDERWALWRRRSAKFTKAALRATPPHPL